MAISSGKPNVLTGQNGELSVEQTQLILDINYTGEPPTRYDFGRAVFGVNKDVREFYITAHPRDEACTDRLTIRGLDLESQTTYTIGEGEKDVHVTLDIEGVTDYTTSPEGKFTVTAADEAPDGNIQLLGDFYFKVSEIQGEKRDIHVNCYILKILQNESPSGIASD